MDQKINHLNFKKTNNLSSNNDTNFQNQKNKLKLKIMEKYDISSNEAEKIINIIENKEKHNINSKRNISNNYQNEDNRTLQQKQILKINDDVYPKSDSDKDMDRANNDNETLINRKGIASEYPSKENVDSILEEIIPNYNQQVSIELEHVDLTFEVQNEKIDTLKESFIRTLKNDKSKKIQIHALKDVSFKIFKGEKVGIIGYNGAGKSTLLNVITGIYPPDKGIVSTYGRISPLLSLGAGFDLNFSGRRNIILNGAVLGYDRDYLESKMDEIIEFSELGDFIDIPIKNYSSGMLAKLGFSIATSVNPDILIIDEILGVGDVNFAKKSADKIKSLMDGGTTVLLVSHSIPQIRELCDKAIWIDNGSVRGMGEVNKICDGYLKDAERASNEQLANIELVK